MLAAAIAPLGKLRDAKPLHPRGAVHAATVDVTHPTPALGVSLFQESGPIECLVRLSRAIVVVRETRLAWVTAGEASAAEPISRLAIATV